MNIEVNVLYSYSAYKLHKYMHTVYLLNRNLYGHFDTLLYVNKTVTDRINVRNYVRAGP